MGLGEVRWMTFTGPTWAADDLLLWHWMILFSCLVLFCKWAGFTEIVGVYSTSTRLFHVWVFMTVFGLGKTVSKFNFNVDSYSTFHFA
jgi:hypothetical protein